MMQEIDRSDLSSSKSSYGSGRDESSAKEENDDDNDDGAINVELIEMKDLRGVEETDRGAADAEGVNGNMSRASKDTVHPDNTDDVLLSNNYSVAGMSPGASKVESKRHYLAVISFLSGDGKANIWWPRVKKRLEGDSICLTEFVLKSPTACRSKGGSMDSSPYEGVILVGGDGIVQEFVSGAFEMRHSNDIWRRLEDHSLKLGIVPCGTDNGIAKGLGVDTLESCIDALLANRVTDLSVVCLTFSSPPVHVMRPSVEIGVNMDNDESQSKRHVLSLCGGGWGLLADVASEADTLRQHPCVRCCRYEYLVFRNLCCSSRGRFARIRWIKPNMSKGSLDDPKTCSSYRGEWTNIGYGNCHGALPGERKNYNGKKTLLWLNRAPLCNMPLLSGLDFVCRIAGRVLCCQTWAETIETTAWEIDSGSCSTGGSVVFNIDGFAVLGTGPVRVRKLPIPLSVHGLRG